MNYMEYQIYVMEISTMSLLVYYKIKNVNPVNKYLMVVVVLKHLVFVYGMEILVLLFNVKNCWTQNHAIKLVDVYGVSLNQVAFYIVIKL